jgi:DNA-binding Lrp family transcriptional regulator
VRVSDPGGLGEMIREKIRTLSGVKETQTSVVTTTFKETARIPIDESDARTM